jgi:hypothetical protein
VDEYRIPAAGDAFASLPGGDEVDEAPHVCNDGWITIGQMAVDPRRARRRRGSRCTFVSGARAIGRVRDGRD